MSKINGCKVIDGEVPSQEQLEEFKTACLPVMEYLNKYYNPMCYAVITEGNGLVLSIEAGVNLPVRD